MFERSFTLECTVFSATSRYLISTDTLSGDSPLTPSCRISLIFSSVEFGIRYVGFMDSNRSTITILQEMGISLSPAQIAEAKAKLEAMNSKK